MKFFITGISRGLGKTLAEECVARGHEVWGVSSTGSEGADQRIRHTRCDISSPTEVEKACEEIVGAGFIPDAVVLNAAVIKDDFEEDIDLALLKKTFDVNLFGNIYWLKLLMPHLSAKAGGGIFLNVSSTASFRAIVRNKLSYPASKCAMDMVFEGLRIQCADKKIRFITANFGPIGETRKMPVFSGTYKQAAEKILARIEGQRPGGTFSFPVCAAIVYKLARFFPDSLVKWALRLRTID